MNTIQNTLSGESLIDVSIGILREHEPEEGYYVAFSGGKDSIVIYDLVRRAGVKHDVHDPTSRKPTTLVVGGMPTRMVLNAIDYIHR